MSIGFKAYSKALCHRCFKLLDELDEVQHRSTIIKSDIEGLYSQSLQKRNIISKNNAIDTDLLIEDPSTSVHDHQYNKQSEQIKEKDIQPILDHDSLKMREFSSGPFDRNQWRKDKAVQDAFHREKDPLYKEVVRKGWRERKAKQRMRDVDNAQKQTILKNDEHSFSEVEEVLSRFVNNQAEPETHNVIQLTHSQGSSDHIFGADKMQINNPQPIAINIFKTDPQMNPDIDGLQLVKDKSKPRVKRQYRKRSHIVHLCKFCMKVFATGDELKKHQKTHTTIECKFCGKILVRIGAWENHLRTFHNVEIQSNVDCPEEVLFCNTCGKQFASKSSLRYHVKLHDGKIYTCDKCGKEFNHPGTFKNHQLVHEEKKYICDKCGKGFRTNFHLIMHDNQTHRKARSWKCKYCEKAFARCATYREHMRSHNAERLVEPHSLLQEVDEASSSLTNLKDDVDSVILKPQSLIENEEVLFNEECEMLGMEEEVINEEANIIIDENQSTCEEQNLVINSETGLYVEEFVVNDDGNIMIGTLLASGNCQ